MAKYNLPTMKELLDSGVHFGHQIRRWHPSMEKYIFSERLGIHVIDLEQTEQLLKEACEVLYNFAAEGSQIVFVGTKRQASEIVKLEAQRSGAFFVCERWLGGTITNFSVINKNIKKLTNLKNRKEQGELDVYTKKEQLLIDREIAKLDRLIGGIVGLNGKPAALVVFDAKRERTAIREAVAADVPVIALIDTNTNPEGVDYPVPGNDDAIRSVALIAKTFADAVEAGYKEYAKSSKAKAAAKAEKESEDTPKESVRVSVAEATRTSKVAGKKHIKNVEDALDNVDELENVKEDLEEKVEEGEAEAEEKPVAAKKAIKTKEKVKKPKDESSSKSKKKGKSK